MTKTFNDNKKLGLWYGARLNSVWSWSIAFILAMGSIRGVLVINLDAPVSIVNMLSAGALLILAAYGWLKRGQYKHPELTWLKNLLKFNLFLGIVNVAIDKSLGVPIDFSVLYLYFVPYVVFLFLRVPSYYFNVVIIIITVAISGSVIGNFIESLKGPKGWESVSEYNLKLKSEEDTMGRSRTGDFFRASGYTGNPHDSANILGMAASFFLISFLVKKKLPYLGLFALAVLSLAMTQSATNIIAAILTFIVFVGYIMIRNRKMSTYVYLFIGLAGIAAIIGTFGEVLSIFTVRVSEGGDWEGMTQQTGIAALLSASPFILVGHAAGFKSEIINIEIAHLKAIFQLGIIHAVILFWIMLYPVFCFLKSKAFCIDALPSAAAIFFGFMSLLHYGSVFRVTSVFLFFAFSAMCLNHIIKAKELALKMNPDYPTGSAMQIRGLPLRA